MAATQPNTGIFPCGGVLPELQVPMINAIVSCLETEHRKLEELILQLSLAATRLADNPNERSAKARAAKAWDELRHELWSHLQIEDSLIFSWGDAHPAISPAALESLKAERQGLRRLLGSLPDFPAGEDGRVESLADGAGFARILIALAQHLDSHIAGYDAAVLPSIVHAASHE